MYFKKKKKKNKLIELSPIKGLLLSNKRENHHTLS